jgi:hypothetical protein
MCFYIIDNNVAMCLMQKRLITKNKLKKELQIRLKKENIERKNVYIDDNNDFYLHGFKEDIYPVIAKISNKKVVGVQLLN